jgi:hypothetical protein
MAKQGLSLQDFLPGCCQAVGQGWGLIGRLDEGSTCFKLIHVLVELLDEGLSSLLPQHGGLLCQSQQGRESANKVEVTIICNLIMEMAPLTVAAFYWLESNNSRLGYLTRKAASLEVAS